MTYVDINKEMPYKQLAIAIWNNFFINQAVVIIGDIEEGGQVYEKGDAVFQYLRYLDRTENYHGNRRKWAVPPKTTGAPKAHKMFTFQRVIIDKQAKWTIWRLQ